MPALKTRFEVYTEVARLARTKDKPNNIVGETELTPKFGEVNLVDIEVDVPKKGLDPESKPSGEVIKESKDEVPE